MAPTQGKKEKKVYMDKEGPPFPNIASTLPLVGPKLIWIYSRSGAANEGSKGERNGNISGHGQSKEIVDNFNPRFTPNHTLCSARSRDLVLD